MSRLATQFIKASVISSLLSVTSVAWATNDQTLPPIPTTDQGVLALLKAADKNSDGKITRQEAEQSLPRIAMAWDKIDIDKKGYVTYEQILMISAASR